MLFCYSYCPIFSRCNKLQSDAALLFVIKLLRKCHHLVCGCLSTIDFIFNLPKILKLYLQICVDLRLNKEDSVRLQSSPLRDARSPTGGN